MAVLELTNISKHFGAIQAVNDVSFSLEAGQVVGLMARSLGFGSNATNYIALFRLAFAAPTPTGLSLLVTLSR